VGIGSVDEHKRADPSEASGTAPSTLFPASLTAVSAPIPGESASGPPQPLLTMIAKRVGAMPTRKAGFWALLITVHPGAIDWPASRRSHSRVGATNFASRHGSSRPGSSPDVVTEKGGISSSWSDQPFEPSR
jgi:hypothetical protein